MPEEKTKKKISDESHYFIYSFIRTTALITFFSTNAWVLFLSPFSLFGGSLYGAIMQLLLAVPLYLLLLSFWANKSVAGLTMVSIASFGLYFLSFMFPTLFANLWVLSTTGSASAGASTVSGLGAISPLSYYKSTYLLSTGVTEKRMGPTMELISDDVVEVTFDISGRLCDKSPIVALLTVQNKAKYELKDILVQLSAIKNPYCFGRSHDDRRCNICGVSFTQSSGAGNTYDELIFNIPKAVPRTLNIPFTTLLFADVMVQDCKIRSDVFLSYQTTSIFPLSFIDYDYYLLNPKSIGKPRSTNSFGKVLISMDAGQQPISVKEDTKEDDTVLLKLGWDQKGSGLVNNPKILLYLPEDLGHCKPFSTVTKAGEDKSYISSLGVEYTGLYGYSQNLNTIKDQEDFNCHSNTDDSETTEEFCERIFNNVYSSDFSSGQNQLLYDSIISNDTSNKLTPTSDSSFDGFPTLKEACMDLASKEKNYSICISKRDINQLGLLTCQINLKNVDVSNIDMSTYLIRADALYSFHTFNEKTFTVYNCDAI